MSESLEEPQKAKYLEVIRLVQSLHWTLLGTIRTEFEDIGECDLNPTQAMILYNIGDAECSTGEVLSRGFYMGSNPSYNLKKLARKGYITQRRSNADRRSVRIGLTPKGKAISARVDEIYERHVRTLSSGGLPGAGDLGQVNASLKNLARFWHEQGYDF